MTSAHANNIQTYNEDDILVATRLFEDHYEELIQLARRNRRRAGMMDTLQTMDVLHESFFKLSGQSAWNNPQHFMRTASLAMRQIIVDHARKKLSQKRGEGVQNVPLSKVEGVLPEYNESPEEIIRISQLMTELEKKSPRLVMIIDARYFGGLTESETALALAVSDRTIRRDWKVARKWLLEKVTAGH